MGDEVTFASGAPQPGEVTTKKISNVVRLKGVCFSLFDGLLRLLRFSKAR